MATLIELYNEAKACKSRHEVLLNNDGIHPTTDPYWGMLKDAASRRSHAVKELRDALMTRTITAHNGNTGGTETITIAEALPRLVDADDTTFGDMAKMSGLINPQPSEGI